MGPALPEPGRLGCFQVTTKGIARAPDAGSPRVEHETKLSALIDGEQDAGMLALRLATEMATEKAKAHGFGLVGTRNTCTSTGALG